MQAIEHYCHPTGWLDVVAEFCRIARKSVVIMLNPMLPNMEAEPGYKDAYDGFRLAMRQYDAHGFRCTSCHVHWGKALVFKLSGDHGDSRWSLVSYLGLGGFTFLALPDVWTQLPPITTYAVAAGAGFSAIGTAFYRKRGMRYRYPIWHAWGK